MLSFAMLSFSALIFSVALSALILFLSDTLRFLVNDEHDRCEIKEKHEQFSYAKYVPPLNAARHVDAFDLHESKPVGCVRH